MKKIILLTMVLMNALVYAQNGLECIVVEKYYVSDANDTSVNDAGGVLPVGSVTYRIYADMLPGYNFQAAYGVDVAPTGSIGAGDHELKIQTTTLFFNNQDRGATTPNFTKARCADNTVMLDSWLSVGAACAGNFGILKTADNGVSNVSNGDGVLQNADASAGIPLTTQDGLVTGTPGNVTIVGIDDSILVFDNQNDGTNGPSFSTYNGSWACLGGCTGPDTVDNKLLIAQITTDGILTFELNIQIGTPTGGVQRFVARNPVGAEISLPCLIDTLGRPALPLPTINITAPSNGANYNVGDTVNITADAVAISGTITQVEFFVDGNSIGIDNSTPYTAPAWIATLGAHNLTATTTDSNSGQATSTVVLINGLTVGVDELNAVAPMVKVFPSPTKDLFQLQISGVKENTSCSYSIQDVTGKFLTQKNVVIIAGNYAEYVNIAALANGIYLVKVTTKGFTSTQKIIKN